jgi:surfeit locus 1 family protein
VPESRSPLVFTPSGVAATVGVFLVVLLCARLGFWQLDRRAERRELNALVAGRTAAPEITDPELLRDTAGLPFRRAGFAGRWDHPRSIVLPGRSHQGAPGVHLLTPLHIDGSALRVLVNRGWVPAPDGVTIDFDFFDDEPAAAVEGILLPFPARADSRGRSQPATAGAAAADTFQRLWFAIDEATLRTQFPYPLAAVQLQVTRDDLPAVAPLPAAVPTLDEGPHLGYAIQWFSFGLIALIGWIAVVLKGSGRTVEDGGEELPDR